MRSVRAVEPTADTFGLMLKNVALSGYHVGGDPGRRRRPLRRLRFTAGRETGNRPDPDRPVETRLVTIDSLIGERHVADMKVDVEGFEIDALRGCTRALSERRTGLIQPEWNAMPQFGAQSRPTPCGQSVLTTHLSAIRPDSQGRLVPVTDPGFGADVFARPVMEEITR